MLISFELDGTRRAAIDGYASPNVTLAFDLLTQKPNQYASWPKSYVS